PRPGTRAPNRAGRRGRAGADQGDAVRRQGRAADRRPPGGGVGRRHRQSLSTGTGRFLVGPRGFRACARRGSHAMTKMFTFVAIAGSAIALSGCREVHGEAAAAPPRPVKVMDVRPSDAPTGIRYAVSIQPSEQVPLAFKAGGYIDQLLQRRGADGRLRALQAGDPVSAGASMAHVRDADYRERVNQARAALDELDVAQTKAQLDRERARTLFAAQALTKPDLDAAEAAFNGNVARIASARAQLEMAQIAL